MELTGLSIIGFSRGESNGGNLNGLNPATGENLDPSYQYASAAEVDKAAQLADQAFESFSQTSGAQRGRFLRKIAENIEALGDTLITRATQETGLPEGRIRTETGRTCGQLRLFATLAEEGSWVDARIDHADPNRTPIPKPDVRSMLRPLGPVVVFGASNFPLAFSVAGGDTASAFAAGNPVIVKAHHAHPGTSELVGLAVSKAVRECELHEGVFSLLYGSGNEVGPCSYGRHSGQSRRDQNSSRRTRRSSELARTSGGSRQKTKTRMVSGASDAQSCPLLSRSRKIEGSRIYGA